VQEHPRHGADKNPMGGRKGGKSSVLPSPSLLPVYQLLNYSARKCFFLLIRQTDDLITVAAILGTFIYGMLPVIPALPITSYRHHYIVVILKVIDKSLER